MVLQATGEIAGTTRYHTIVREHRRVEIGFSWVGLPWQRSPVNSKTKYLLLRHAFEQAHCQRVEFKADRENAPSIRALLRIGAQQEGVLRRYMHSAHKGARDVAIFSIIDADWPALKVRLEARLYDTS